MSRPPGAIIDAAALPRLREAIDALYPSPPSFDLACTGFSIHGFGTITLDSCACIARADIVYCYPASPGHLAFIEALNPRVVDVNATIYVKGADFETAYAAIVDTVMGSLREGLRVAYVVQGSPSFHCGTAVILTRNARREGYAVSVLGGVSSFELMSAYLSARHDLSNAQLYSVARAVRGQVRICTSAPCFLFDLGRFALPAVRENAGKLSTARLMQLEDTLVRLYGPDHPLDILHVRHDGGFASRQAGIRGFHRLLAETGSGVTLFIPPLPGRESHPMALETRHQHSIMTGPAPVRRRSRHNAPGCGEAPADRRDN